MKRYRSSLSERRRTVWRPKSLAGAPTFGPRTLKPFSQYRAASLTPRCAL